MKKIELIYYATLLLISHLLGYFLSKLGYINSYNIISATGIALAIGTLSYYFFNVDFKNMNLNRLLIPQLIIGISIFESNSINTFLQTFYQNATPIHGALFVISLTFLILLAYENKHIED